METYYFSNSQNQSGYTKEERRLLFNPTAEKGQKEKKTNLCKGIIVFLSI